MSAEVIVALIALVVGAIMVIYAVFALAQREGLFWLGFAVMMIGLFLVGVSE